MKLFTIRLKIKEIINIFLAEQLLLDYCIEDIQLMRSSIK